MAALLGLTPGESRTSRVADIVGADAFARLEKGETNAIYLPREVADALGAIGAYVAWTLLDQDWPQTLAWGGAIATAMLLSLAYGRLLAPRLHLDGRHEGAEPQGPAHSQLDRAPARR